MDTPSEFLAFLNGVISRCYQVCNYFHAVHAGTGADYTHPLMPHGVMSRTSHQIPARLPWTTCA